MNKILVLFDSATGNVQQMAELVGEGAALVPDTEVRVRSVEAVSYTHLTLPTISDV